MARPGAWDPGPTIVGSCRAFYLPIKFTREADKPGGQGLGVGGQGQGARARGQGQGPGAKGKLKATSVGISARVRALGLLRPLSLSAKALPRSNALENADAPVALRHWPPAVAQQQVAGRAPPF